MNWPQPPNNETQKQNLYVEYRAQTAKWQSPRQLNCTTQTIRQVSAWIIRQVLIEPTVKAGILAAM